MVLGLSRARHGAGQDRRVITGVLRRRGTAGLKPGGNCFRGAVGYGRHGSCRQSQHAITPGNRRADPAAAGIPAAACLHAGAMAPAGMVPAGMVPGIMAPAFAGAVPAQFRAGARGGGCRRWPAGTAPPVGGAARAGNGAADGLHGVWAARYWPGGWIGPPEWCPAMAGHGAGTASPGGVCAPPGNGSPGSVRRPVGRRFPVADGLLRVWGGAVPVRWGRHTGVPVGTPGWRSYYEHGLWDLAGFARCGQAQAGRRRMGLNYTPRLL